MIKNIYVFPNFNIACTDAKGNQVVAEQKNILADVLRGMLKRKVANKKTILRTVTEGIVKERTIGEYLEIEL